VPHPRDIPESILVFVNFDLNRPRAILPATGSFQGLYDDIASGPWDFTLRTTVISLLHTCQASRASTEAIFSLDVDEPTEAWNANLWDPATDTLYLPGFASEDGDHLFHLWLCDRRSQPHLGLKLATHVALQLDMCFMLATKLISEYGEDIGGPLFPRARFEDSQDQWLENLPSLKTLTLCIDPLRFTNYRHGHAVPYPSLNVPVHNLNNYTPSKIREEITEMFELHLEDLVDQDEPRPDLAAPHVEVAVLCWKNALSRPWKADLPQRTEQTSPR
jgi:hypothetical protein